ncbi:hypothetical protein ACHAXM_005972 [Skeletonema potamos]
MSFTTPIRQRTASENEISDRFKKSANSCGATTPPRSMSSSSSSKQMYTTEFIKALFGDAGVVVGDFSCSYQRQAGRLYVSTDAVFFYSNLFGFEKRIKIDYKHALEIDLVRTTSVFIKTIDDEFIFRSFENRQSVLELIKTFHSKISSSSTKLTADVQSTIINLEDTKHNDLTSLSEHDNESKQPGSTDHDTLKGTKTHTPKAGSMVSNSVDGTFFWEKMKKHSIEWESIITAEKLPCRSVAEFFENFLRDDAKRSMSYFQSKVMGDNNVSLEAWTKNSAPEGERNAVDSLSRMIEFEHATRWAVAKVKRRQTYQMCGKNAIIQNFTHLLGIPQADAFFVEDMWLLESGGANHVTLDVKCRIVWLKHTMLKSVITNRTKTEAKEWFDKYIPFVGQELVEKPHQVQGDEEVTTETNQVISLLFSIAKIVRFIFGLCRDSPVVALVALAIYTYRLKQRILLLEELVDEIQLKMIQQLERLSEEE